MAITKQKKSEILHKLEDGLRGAETIVFVNFHGLPVSETTLLRKKLREEGVRYYVAKKTLVKRAFAAMGTKGTPPPLDGELGIAWSGDPIASAKGVYEFAKLYKEKLALLGGVYQGAYMSKAEITNLAMIPSHLGLLGQFVGILNESLAKVVRVIDSKAKHMEVTPA